MTDLMTNLMAGLNFTQPVESFILLTSNEKLRLSLNSKSEWVNREKLLTIYNWSEIPKQYHENFEQLFEKASAFEKAYGHPLCWRSVFRSWAHHIRVYEGINKLRIKQGLEPLKIPTLSNHLFMRAFDCAPVDKPIQHLHDFVKDGSVLKELKVWCEALVFTPTWLHCQTVPYASWNPDKSYFFNIK